ncbi:tumor protein p53-inducible nuclear protein 2 isoform X1 [Pygocentrus nattereri]|uniref:Tumor protein p53 inducible nuclear protein 2 n=1 Tax=Pygocentrus nattereri TaxID=42514 RepID=A0AAR2ITT2_PYGNA|nr:tumor protein p53-inducible nuclear protein 2 isoform X1 [Pygocentrus nattereri]XP_017553702.1 tumor protein p53-inducible nuclear protein 2 isoform X1 [Pygocentrus nattereri]
MFQRLSNLLFGEVEDVSAELNGPKPCVTEADDEGWLLVNLPGNGDCTMLGEDGAEAPPTAQSLPNSECQRAESKHVPATPPRTCDPAPSPRKSCRTRVAKAKAACSPSPRSPGFPFCPNSPSPVGSVGVKALSSPAHCPLGSAPVSPGSRSDCSSGGSGLERGSMDESWFVTPPPCFTAEGATAEASPMEDLLIEHPSMSVYVSPGNLSVVEQSVASLTSSVSRMSESVPPPVVRSSMPPRMARGAACQVVPLAKVTQVSRVQRAKARVERRHLGRNRMQRQNRVREQIPRHTAGARTSFLHQPCQRSLCH